VGRRGKQETAVPMADGIATGPSPRGLANRAFSITTDLAGQKAEITPVLAAFGTAGFAATHWCHDWAGEPVFYSAAFAEEVRRLAGAAGLRIADVHAFSGTDATGITYSDELFAAMALNRAEFAARVGADVLVLHLPPHPVPDPAVAAQAAIQAVRRILPPCRGFGVRLAIENLVGPAHVPALYDALFAEFAPDELGFCYDSGHALVARQADLLARYAGRLVATHLHDNDGTADQHRLPGEGVADWPAILGMIQRCGYCREPNLEVHLPKGADLADFCTLARRRLAELWGAARR